MASIQKLHVHSDGSFGGGASATDTGKECRGSRVVPYSATPDSDCTPTNTSSSGSYNGKFLSICAMPSYKDKSHEELRFEDYGLNDKGGESSPSRVETSCIPSSRTAENTGSFSTNDLIKVSQYGSFGRVASATDTGKECRGSRVPYSTTPDSDSRPTYTSSSAPNQVNGAGSYNGKILSISAMPSYKDKSHEELRFEDYGLKVHSDGSFGGGASATDTGKECRGSRVVPYSTTPDSDCRPTYTSSSAPNQVNGAGSYDGKILSISAMPSYKDKSYEELRFEDYGLKVHSDGSFGGGASATDTGKECRGSRVVPYSTTPDSDCRPTYTSSSAPNQVNGAGSYNGKILSISAMPSYKDKSHEELRFEDYGLKVHSDGSFGGGASATDTGKECRGSRVVLYSTTPDSDCRPTYTSSSAPNQVNGAGSYNGKILSISAMPSYKDKSHEELRFEDYGLKVHSDGSFGGGASATDTGKKCRGSRVVPYSTTPDSDCRPTYTSSSGEIVGKAYHGKVNFGPVLISNQHEHDVAARKAGDIVARLPKLPDGGYYTEPSLQKLAAKEMEEAGFCRHVNEFVVGRQGYGSIKFVGETDVRHLDIKSMVQFDDRGVILYPDGRKKTGVGQELNKAVVVTLLNLKCINRKTGKQYVEGYRVESFREVLMNKSVELGFEFVSYDPVRGEWKFRVQHFC